MLSFGKQAHFRNTSLYISQHQYEINKCMDTTLLNYKPFKTLTNFLNSKRFIKILLENKIVKYQ